MGKALGMWVLLSLFGFVGWNYAMPQFIARAGQHPIGILHAFGIAALVMIGLVVAGKTK